MNISMNITARMSLLIGAGLLAAGLATGPAQASPPPPYDDGDTIGYFSDRSDCDWVARVGDLQNRWDSPRCSMVDRGPHRYMWELTADRRGTTNDFPDHHHGGPHHGPTHHPRP